MRILIIVILALILSLTLNGCSSSEEELAIKKNESALFMGSEQLERKVVIQDSIYDPLPSEVENIQSLPNQGGPQPLPNVDLSKPLIITKMPYKEKGKTIKE